jgi:hypothetical protein
VLALRYAARCLPPVSMTVGGVVLRGVRHGICGDLR